MKRIVLPSNIKDSFNRYHRFIPVLSFFAGFIWDNVTLTRIDKLSDNIFILAYLICLGILIGLLNFNEKGLINKPILLKYNMWYPAAIQFFLGGLFSTYVVFYFKSASFTKTSLFLILLLLLLVANEFLTKRLTNTYLLISLFFMASFSFLIFFLPVITKTMNVLIFITAGIMSLILIYIFLYVFYRFKIFITESIFHKHLGLIGLIFILINIFYWLNWIPPVPLSLKYAGIYHHVERKDNSYQLRYEKPTWYQIFKSDDRDFYYASGDTVFCFASVFAPTHLSKKILHHWQVFSNRNNKWTTTDRTGYELLGGREGGYRGYTFKKNITDGKWRVNIITEDDQILGRINFSIQTKANNQKIWKTIYK